jgi:dTDP-4-dehydrorhamnose reductase
MAPAGNPQRLLVTGASGFLGWHLCRLAAFMGCRAVNLRPVSIKTAAAAAPRPPDVSLNSHRAYRLGYGPADLDRSLENMAAAFRKEGS